MITDTALKITATENQIKRILANAVNSSSVVGLGFLQDTGSSFDGSEFECVEGYAGHERGYYLDYVHGKMVKLRVYKDSQCEGNEWKVSPKHPRHDYQSWVVDYPTTQDLVDSILLK